MPKRGKQGGDDEVKPVMQKHFRELKLYTARQYFTWCEKYGAEPSLEKTAAERRAELELPGKLAETALKRERVHSNPRKFIEQACAGTIDAATASRPGWAEAARAIGKSKDDEGRRESLKDFLLHLEDVSDLVFSSASVRRDSALYIDALIRLHDRKKQWIRPVEDWRPSSHNLRRQFGSLLRHLLALYETPAFLDAVWLRGDAGSYRYRDWFIHLARGKNLRSAKTPYPMTKMTVHHFLDAPDGYSIEGALMLADIRAAGGGRRLADALMATRLGSVVETEEEKRAFWLSVYRFFIDNPLLDLRHVGPVVDFLAHQKFEARELVTAAGNVERRPPPQPNLSMQRRTPETLLRQVEEWHGELRKTKGIDQRFWRPSGWKAASFETGSKDERVTWRFTELLTGAELADEGRMMRHCIATYADSCVRGAYSVWSMQREYGAREKVLTIAVDAKGVVVEARGRANRLPDAGEKELVGKWMRHSGLRPGPYLFGWN